MLKSAAVAYALPSSSASAAQNILADIGLFLSETARSAYRNLSGCDIAKPWCARTKIDTFRPRTYSVSFRQN
jgi:hypothetical protein